MRDTRIHRAAPQFPKGSVRYEELLAQRIRLGRRRIDMLCHDERLEARAALALNRQCLDLDELLGQDPRYGLDQELRVLPAEEPRFHRWPQLPLDYEEDPCRACQRINISLGAEPLLPPPPHPHEWDGFAWPRSAA